jgi:hypothetical protein
VIPRNGNLLIRDHIVLHTAIIHFMGMMMWWWELGRIAPEVRAFGAEW